MVLAWQTKEGLRVLDGLLHPCRQSWVAGRPFGKPCGEIGLGLGETAPVVEPAQFLQAIVAAFSVR